jgi:aryl-alcohol dehydrogenase-like predicted oxidoreductase
MERRPFGKTDMAVSVLGFGGAEIGYEKASPQTVETLLHRALDAGLNVIDTAECYYDSEAMIGQAVAGRRKDFYLFTKCGHPEGPGKADWSRPSLMKSIERSLKRLRTDCVDLVQLHSCSELELRKGEVITALQEARQKGYTRYLGYSGDGTAARYAIECGAFDVLQTSVNLADQEANALTLPLAQQRGMGVIAKRPIANAAWKYSTLPDNDYHQEYWRRLQKLRYDFLGDNVAEVALRFTLTTPSVHTAIVGTTRPERWAENARIVEQGPLPREQYEAICQRWKEIAEPTWVGQQ